jgi:hypothetical protein
MKLTYILTISLYLLNFATPIEKFFTVAASIKANSISICRIHFTKEHGIIYAVKEEDENYFIDKMNYFTELDLDSDDFETDIIRPDEHGFQLQYSKVGLFHFSKSVDSKYDIKIFDKAHKVNL